MEFYFDLERKGSKNLYTQLYEKLKNRILKGKLEAHTRLPAIRNIAKKNNINPATVVKAYDLLERDELIYKKVGSGSYVSPGLIKNNVELNYKDKEKNDSLEMLDYGQVDLADSINFASATPSPSLFPVEDFKFALNEVLTRDKGKAFTYQKSQGYFPLRESINKYLQKNKIDTKIDNIQIVSGAQQAIDLLAKILLNFGDEVIVEEPTYTGALSAFRSRKASIKGIKLQKDGINLNLLEKKVKENRVSFIYIMTSFQNPTGVSWSKNKKEKLLKLATKYNFLIIEDDCLSELYFTEQKPLSLKSLDKEGRVIYIKSFSKIFMPGLRLAFAILPDKLLPRMLAAKHATDISSAGITQRSFDLYLREGLWEKHL
ncbi:MAG: PLP-dependent aminotransferase family protein, partial [Bacillota bacterium]